MPGLGSRPGNEHPHQLFAAGVTNVGTGETLIKNILIEDNNPTLNLAPGSHTYRMRPSSCKITNHLRRHRRLRRAERRRHRAPLMEARREQRSWMGWLRRHVHNGRLRNTDAQPASLQEVRFEVAVGLAAGGGGGGDPWTDARVGWYLGEESGVRVRSQGTMQFCKRVSATRFIPRARRRGQSSLPRLTYASLDH
jgi:hypothetical protein